MKRFYSTAVLFLALFVAACGSDGNSDSGKATGNDNDIEINDSSYSTDENASGEKDDKNHGPDEEDNTEDEEDSDNHSETDPVPDADNEDNGNEPEEKCVHVTGAEFRSRFEGTQSTYLSNLIPDQGDTALKDWLLMIFYGSQKPGTYDLGNGLNKNFKTCEQCIRVVQDPNDAAPQMAKHFFQQSGTLVLEEVLSDEELQEKAHIFKEDDGSLKARSKGYMKDVKLVEVKIIDYVTKPVENGSCFIIDEMKWDTMCHPQCEGKTCGDDGCGGTCGTCGDDEMCSAEGQCIAESCEETTLEAFVTEKGDLVSYVTPGIGAEDADIFSFVTPYPDQIKPGTFNLAEAPDNNYKDCKHCLLYYEDGYTSKKRIFFQEKGTVTIDKVVEESVPAKSGVAAVYTRTKGSMKGVKLVEVEMTGQPHWQAMPVIGGKCIRIKDVEWDRTPECTEDSQCDNGLVCESDPASENFHKCIKDDPCTGITLGEIAYEKILGAYTATYAPSSGDAAKADKFLMRFTDPGQEAEVVDFTEGKKSTITVEIEEDEYDAAAGKGKKYVAVSGKLHIDSYEMDMMTWEAKAAGKLDYVMFLEHKMDESMNLVPVADGACLRVESAIWNDVEK